MRLTSTLGAVLLAACASVGAGDESAVIVDATRDSYEELVRTVSGALNVATVTIAEGALTHDSVLLIERAAIRDERGRLVDGRSLDRPEEFRLIRRGSDCILVHSRTGNRSVLANTRCRAAER